MRVSGTPLGDLKRNGVRDLLGCDECERDGSVAAALRVPGVGAPQGFVEPIGRESH